MPITLRQLERDEIPLIGQIDNSDCVTARYVVHPQADGLGLCLRREIIDPPQEEPNWGEKELAHRYALWIRNRDEEGAVFLGAFEQGRLVGMVAVARRPGGRTAELYALHVDRSCRHRGIGRALLDETEQQCIRWRCDTLILYTGFKASTLDFYRARGYRVVGIQTPTIRTKNFDLTLAKTLGG